MSKQILAVIGSTGAQGGALVQAALEDGTFAVRAITRNVDSEKGRALAALGAEVVGADTDDAASVTRAFAGVHGAFCMTNFWEHFSPARETQQARNLAQACKDAGVAHAVWSTLEDVRRWVPLSDERMPTLHERYKCPHFDSKGEADAAFRDLGVPTTFLLTSFYWENLISFGMGPKAGPDGELAFVLPMADKKLPGIAAGDIGRSAFAVLKQGQEWIGKSVGIAGDHLTGAEMAATLSRALGREVTYQYVPPEVYRTFGFPGAEDLANMFQFKRDFEADFCGARDLGVARRLNPGLQTFAAWLDQHGRQIPLG